MTKCIQSFCWTVAKVVAVIALSISVSETGKCRRAK
jgi:hypothetical protein